MNSTYLRKYGITRTQILAAINYAMEIEQDDQYQRITWCGLCDLFSFRKSNFLAYDNIPDFLKSIGGRPRGEFFWGYPDIRNKKAINQRLMMLAFMLEWSKRDD